MQFSNVIITNIGFMQRVINQPKGKLKNSKPIDSDNNFNIFDTLRFPTKRLGYYD